MRRSRSDSPAPWDSLRPPASDLGGVQRQLINAAPAARVTWFSWVTAVVEIAADLFFAVVGLAVLRGRRPVHSSVQFG
jgi:hypothetical protein